VSKSGAIVEFERRVIQNANGEASKLNFKSEFSLLSVEEGGRGIIDSGTVNCCLSVSNMFTCSLENIKSKTSKYEMKNVKPHLVFVSYVTSIVRSDVSRPKALQGDPASVSFAVNPL
jgi:hypothetical protein